MTQTQVYPYRGVPEMQLPWMKQQSRGQFLESHTHTSNK